MKRVTQSRLNAINNAGSMIESIDFQSELTDREIEEHHLIGKLLIENNREVLKLLIRLYNEGICSGTQ